MKKIRLTKEQKEAMKKFEEQQKKEEEQLRQKGYLFIQNKLTMLDEIPKTPTLEDILQNILQQLQQINQELKAQSKILLQKPKK